MASTLKTSSVPTTTTSQSPSLSPTTSISDSTVKGDLDEFTDDDSDLSDFKTKKSGKKLSKDSMGGKGIDIMAPVRLAAAAIASAGGSIFRVNASSSSKRERGSGSKPSWTPRQAQVEYLIMR